MSTSSSFNTALKMFKTYTASRIKTSLITNKKNLLDQSKIEMNFIRKPAYKK